jgi:hypothetical protein
MLGAEDNVMLKSFPQFGHNYNYVSRSVIYPWFNEHLKLEQKEPIVEEDFKPLTIPELSVWDEKHPAPPSDYEHQQAFLHSWAETSQKQIESLTPKDETSLREYKKIVGGAVEVMIGHGLPDKKSFQSSDRVPFDLLRLGEYAAIKECVNNSQQRTELPLILINVLEKRSNQRMVIWVDPQGKQSLFADDGKFRPSVQKLLDAGYCVVGADLFGQGEFTPDGKPIAKAKMLKEPYGGFTFCYNPPTFSQRVRDLLTLVSFVKDFGGPNQVDMIGLNGAGHWVAAARAIAGDKIDRAVIDTAGFRFAGIKTFDDPDFLPGGVKYGDLPGMIALSAPYPLWLAGEGNSLPPIVSAAYKAAGKEVNATVYSGNAADKESAAVEWLLK